MVHLVVVAGGAAWHVVGHLVEHVVGDVRHGTHGARLVVVAEVVVHVQQVLVSVVPD